MAACVKPEPSERVWCEAPRCGWHGTVGTCHPKPGELVCCPRCGRPVMRVLCRPAAGVGED